MFPRVFVWRKFCFVDAGRGWTAHDFVWSSCHNWTRICPSLVTQFPQCVFSPTRPADLPAGRRLFAAFFWHDKESLWSDTVLSIWLLPYWAQLTASVRRSIGASCTRRDFSVYSRFTINNVSSCLTHQYSRARRGIRTNTTPPRAAGNRGHAICLGYFSMNSIEPSVLLQLRRRRGETHFHFHHDRFPFQGRIFYY